MVVAGPVQLAVANQGATLHTSSNFTLHCLNRCTLLVAISIVFHSNANLISNLILTLDSLLGLDGGLLGGMEFDFIL